MRNFVLDEVIFGVILDIVEGMLFNLILDYMGICLNGERFIGKCIFMNWKLIDVDENYYLFVNNFVFIYCEGEVDDKVDLILIIICDIFNYIFGGVKSFEVVFVD